MRLWASDWPVRTAVPDTDPDVDDRRGMRLEALEAFHAATCDGPIADAARSGAADGVEHRRPPTRRSGAVDVAPTGFEPALPP